MARDEVVGRLGAERGVETGEEPRVFNDSVRFVVHVLRGRERARRDLRRAGTSQVAAAGVSRGDWTLTGDRTRAKNAAQAGPPGMSPHAEDPPLAESPGKWSPTL